MSFPRLYSLLCLLLGTLISVPATAASPVIHGGQVRDRFIMRDPGQTEPSRGLTIEIINELTKRMELPVRHISCPFKRCISSLGSGEIDIMMFVTLNPERAKYMEFIQVWPNPLSIHFYTRKSERHKLTTLDDLLQMRVGQVKGFFYSKKLDLIPRERYITVIKELQLPRMLQAHRIDAFPVYGDSHNFMDRDFPNLALAPFRLPGPNFAILAISKKSPHLHRLKQFNDTLAEMGIDGTLDAAWGRYHNGAPIRMPPELRAQADKHQQHRQEL